MSLSTPFIRRPVATSLIAIAIALAGTVGFIFLPASFFPQADFPASGVRRLLDIAIVGGLIFSRMLTGFTAPLVSLSMDRFRTGWQRSRKIAMTSIPQEAHWIFLSTQK